MTTRILKLPNVTFSSGLQPDDATAAYWMHQVTIRLRREICWCWHERGGQGELASGSLPAFTDRASTSLDIRRYQEEKIAFFRTDPTARYLSDQIEKETCPTEENRVRGSFGWVIDELNLNNTAAFVLALGLSSVFDNAVGSVIAACLNDPAGKFPSLALAQKLWDFPDRVISLADPVHPLFHAGLLRYDNKRANRDGVFDWDSPIVVPLQVAEHLLYPGSASLRSCEPISESPSENDRMTDSIRLAASDLSTNTKRALRIAPVCGPRGACFETVAGLIARGSGRKVVRFIGDPHLLLDKQYFDTLAAVCWLRGVDLYLNQPAVCVLLDDTRRPDIRVLPPQSIPITVFLSVNDRKKLGSLPEHLLLPVVEAPRFDYHERLAYWTKALGRRAGGLEASISESSRRFRFEKETIDAVVKRLEGLSGTISKDRFVEACRTEAGMDLGDLAQRVVPRFDEEKLILHRKQHLQLEEIEQAMRSLTKVHYGWGTAKVWNESGISVLFAGSPGTGKTMAAEILAINLNLPMYRIDLSQVVNKYIGETEKNLKTLFDAAEAFDVILFFDEADSLFGRRTEVKDAHDRYANLEISYLLDRMERFKGLAILATNRKKDLDEAFLRRLRYIVDFPHPGVRQREQIWRQVIPEKVDSSSLDFVFLPRQFPLTGGHIRSIVFNACLQSADIVTDIPDGFEGRLTMEAVIKAVKREYDKLNRSVSLEYFGAYMSIAKDLERENDTGQD